MKIINIYTIRRIVEFLFSTIGFWIHIKPIRKDVVQRSGLNLNVGCGQYVINNFISLDYFSERYYNKLTRGFKGRVFYDIRNDSLPYENDSVDNIYCSHVIEHLESKHAERFFQESFRVLKKGGCLRIACPDSEFLYNMMLSNSEFFCWHPMYEQNGDNTKCFIIEVAAHRQNLGEMPYSILMPTLREGGRYNADNPQPHINNWDFARVKEIGSKAGFQNIYKSKCRGSVSKSMQGFDMDRTISEMSLYVDLVKK